MHLTRYYAFELCAASLKTWAGGSYTGRMPPELICLYHMACGLEFIHSQKLVHRDISPDNVLISLAGDRLAISDFGLCKPVSETGSYQFSSKVRGKEMWWAPELIERVEDRANQKRGTIKSDTFAMGCVFYYLLTRGQHPFLADAKYQVIDNIKKRQSNIEST